MSSTEWSLEEKEKYVDMLLLYLKNTIEKIGCSLEHYYFDFRIKNETFWYEEDGYDFTKFTELSSLSKEEVQTIIKKCIAHEYIQGSISKFSITRQGFARANSTEKSALYKTQELNTNYNFNGPVHLNNSQIGNNNQQDICIKNNIEDLINFIDSLQATTEEKNNAKSLLIKFIEHPIISSAIGTGVNIFIKNLLGG